MLPRHPVLSPSFAQKETITQRIRVPLLTSSLGSLYPCRILPPALTCVPPPLHTHLPPPPPPSQVPRWNLSGHLKPLLLSSTEQGLRIPPPHHSAWPRPSALGFPVATTGSSVARVPPWLPGCGYTWKVSFGATLSPYSLSRHCGVMFSVSSCCGRPRGHRGYWTLWAVIVLQSPFPGSAGQTPCLPSTHPAALTWDPRLSSVLFMTPDSDPRKTQASYCSLGDMSISLLECACLPQLDVPRPSPTHHYLVLEYVAALRAVISHERPSLSTQDQHGAQGPRGWGILGKTGWPQGGLFQFQAIFSCCLN